MHTSSIDLCFLFDGCLFCCYRFSNKLCPETCACPLFLCDQLDGCSLRGGLAPQPSRLQSLTTLHHTGQDTVYTALHHKVQQPGNASSMTRKKKWKVKQHKGYIKQNEES